MTAQAIIFLGAPGAGKGTQARVISQTLGFPHVSTGDILREAVRKKDSLGLAVKAKMERGDLVPDDLVCRLVEDRISKPDCQDGVILDGFPRTLGQARFLDDMLAKGGRAHPVVVNLRLDPDTVIKRLTGRRTCSKCGEIYNIHLNPPHRDGACDKDGGKLIQRADDNEEAIRQRLLAYERDTVPLIDYYRRGNTLHDVDGNGEPEAITQRVLSILKSA